MHAVAEELVVVLGGQVAGRITRTSVNSDPEFTYDDDYLLRGDVPLSTRLPLGPGRFKAKAVLPFIEGLIPENAETRQRWAERLSAEAGEAVSDDAFSLLSRMGWDCPGAVQFASPDDLDEMLARGGQVEPTSEAEIEERLRVLRDDSASWSLPDEHWSLPGQQEKFTLVRRDDGWFSATGSAATTHIIKPGIGKMHNQALVEYATMRAADQVGLDIAHVDFTYFGEEPAIVVERFDRVDVGGEIVRVHQEDFCQAAGRLPNRKYEVHGGPGLDTMARIITEHSSNPIEDRWAVGEFLAVNYIAGAPDGHAKNISLALWPDDTHVAPLYDLATSFPYDQRNPALRTVALSVGGRREFGRVLGKHWDRAANTLGLDPVRFRHSVRDLASNFPDAFADALREVERPEADEVRERALPHLQRHIDDLVARLDDPPDPGPRAVSRSPRTSSRSDRGKTSPASNAGSFRPRTTGEVDLDLN